MLDLVKTIAKFLPTYLTSVIALLTRPKTYIDRRNRTNEYLEDSLLFAGVSACISLLLTPRLFLPDGDIIESLGTRLVVGLVMAFSAAAMIAAACRLVGGKAPFMQFLVTYLYMSGMTAILSSALFFLAFGIAFAIDAEAVKQFVHLGRENTPFAAMSKDEARKFIQVVRSPAVIMLSVSNCFIFAWFIACWGSFRKIARLSRTRSAIAFVLAFVVLAPILGFVFALAQRGLGLV